MLKEDSAIRIAYLPDPVKLEQREAGYPPPTVRDRICLESAMRLESISVADVHRGVLASGAYNVLCVPGGFAPHTASRLGERGAALIRRFVDGGGGYVGICAGAFVAIALGLLPVRVRDVDHVGAPSGLVRLVFTQAGQRVLGAGDAEVSARYANGPLLEFEGDGVHVLARYRTDFRGASVPMVGSPAVVCGRRGASGGMVALSSPHLEDGATEATRAPFRNLMRLAAAPFAVDFLC